MKRKVIVACGGAVATSTMAAEEIKELCDANHIELDLVQCRVTEIETYMDGCRSYLYHCQGRSRLWQYSRRSRYAFCFRRGY